MKDRTGNTASRKLRLAVVGQEDVAEAVCGAFAEHSQVLLPILELVDNASASIDELMNGAARGFVEQLLVLSAQEVAGAKHPGRRMGEVLWHGSSPAASCSVKGSLPSGARAYAVAPLAARKWPL